MYLDLESEALLREKNRRVFYQILTFLFVTLFFFLLYVNSKHEETNRKSAEANFMLADKNQRLIMNNESLRRALDNCRKIRGEALFRVNYIRTEENPTQTE